MPFMVCGSCSAQIDVAGLAPGTKITCSECSAKLVVDRQTTLMDSSDAQEAIRRARDQVKGTTLVAVKCPNCGAELRMHEEDAAAGSMFRCTDCGQKILMQKKTGAKGSDTVAFPTLAADGTLLDMGDTREAIRKPPDKKKK